MKVFLVDDEIAIRENLRNSFPWEKSGFVLIGEAPDGEMALPMIRDLNPDILLTDIKMPFMDGLSLCREVRRTMPWVGVIILSGYDDFSYARQAMSMGVREYLLKPVTAAELEAALLRVKEAILDSEQSQAGGEKDGEKALMREMLLSTLFTEEEDREEDRALLEKMKGLGVNLEAGYYLVIDIAFDTEGCGRAEGRNALAHLAENEGGTVHVCAAPKGARALVLGSTEQDAEERAYSFASSALHLPELEDCSQLLLCVGETVGNYYDIRRSMRSARHVRHMLTAWETRQRRIAGVGEVSQQRQMPENLELSPLYERLQYARNEEIRQILLDYTATLDPMLAAGYLQVAAPIAARRIVQESGGDSQKVLDQGLIQEMLQNPGSGSLQQLIELLQQAIAYRDRSGRGFDESPISRARVYLARNFSNPNLMLQDVAEEIGMSQSHCSTVFAQETGITFTQYLTGLRIGKAKELLTATEMKTSQIAMEVGYNDSHYFSYLFKKTTGMTPSEFRKSEKE